MRLRRITGPDLIFWQAMKTEQHMIRLKGFEPRSRDLGPGLDEAWIIMERAHDLDRRKITLLIDAREDLRRNRRGD